jgi:hypothetical protein
MFLNTKTENYIRNALKKGDFLERLNFGPISTPCILGTVTARQNHLHITFRDFEIKITIEYFAQKFELK